MAECLLTVLNGHPSGHFPVLSSCVLPFTEATRSGLSHFAVLSLVLVVVVVVGWFLFIFWFCCCCVCACVCAEVELRALHMLAKHSAIQLHFGPAIL